MINNMPFASNKNARELGIDITRKFVVVDDGNLGYVKNGDVVKVHYNDQTCNPFFDNLTRGNGLYDKLSVQWSHLDYYTPTFKIGDRVMVIDTLLPKERESYVGKTGSVIAIRGDASVAIIILDFDNSEYRFAFQNLVLVEEKKEEKEKVGNCSVIFSEEIIKGVRHGTVLFDESLSCFNSKPNKTFMNKIVDFAKGLMLSEGEKLLRKYGLKDECGNYTEAYNELRRNEANLDFEKKAVEFCQKQGAEEAEKNEKK